MSKGLFVISTGTDVGKTFISALLVKKLHEAGFKSGYYKAALSGATWQKGKLIPNDADYVNFVSGIDQSLEDMVTYVYESAVSPHLAAKREGNPVVLEKVLTAYTLLTAQYDYLTVEGSGGIVCPLVYDENRSLMLTDVIQALQLKTILVAPAGLGTINHTVLTVEYARKIGIEVLGLILNRFHTNNAMEEDNRYMLEQLTGLPVIATVEDDEQNIKITLTDLVELYE